MVVPGVASLLLPCRPSYVSRFVVAVVVFSVNFRLGERSLADRGKECRERFQPFTANTNPSPAIIVVLRMVPICATLNNISPCLIQRMPTGTWGEAMRPISDAQGRGPFAPAGCRIAGLESVDAGREFFAAEALKSGHLPLVLVPDSGDDRQLSVGDDFRQRSRRFPSFGVTARKLPCWHLNRRATPART